MCLGLPASAGAQGWQPDRNVELIVPAGAGGSLDNTGRTIERVGNALRLLSSSSTVVNRAGGGHAVAYSYLNQHRGDPHYLSITSSTILTNYINGRLPHTYTEFTPLATMVTEYIAVAVKTDSPIKTGKDFVEALKKDPASLSIGLSSAVGGTHHIATAMPLRTAGVDLKKLKLVAFNSSSDAITALLGGHIDAVSTSNVIIEPHVAEGRLRAIAISAPKRIPGAFSAVPTWPEQGYKGVFENWRGLIGAKGLTAAQVAFWDKVLKGVSDSDEFRKFVERNHWVLEFRNAQATRAFMKESYDDLKDIMAALGLAKR